MDTTWPDDKDKDKDKPPVVADGAPVAPRKKRPRALIVAPALLGVALLIALIVWWRGRGKETTDDAQVDGHIVAVSPRIPGSVKRVLVKDNQVVKAGDVLVELDDRELRTHLAAAQADVAAAQAAQRAAAAQLLLTQRSVAATVTEAKGGVRQASSGISSSRAGIASARADLSAANSRAALAEIEYRRVKNLYDQGAVSHAEIDAKQAQLDQAKANLDLARARVAGAQQGASASVGALEVAQGHMTQAQTGPEQVELMQAQLESAAARVQQAQAALSMAELGSSFAQIAAPVGGVVSRRSVEVGQMVGPTSPLLAIIPTDDVWVTANFKEDQLADMRPGQKASIHIDAYGKDLPGHVDSLAGASGARFSLLPPDNASGNYIKVVQRVPVLVRFEGQPGLDLKPGMSANVTVYTGD